jgi:hypothetical protein
MKLGYVAAVMLLLGLCLFATASKAESRRLMLVASSQSPVPTLSLKEIKFLYLGVPVIKNGIQINPLRNVSTPLLREVFLQKVLFMSEEAYEDQLLSRVFRQGATRPSVYASTPDLVRALSSQSNALSYMWADELKAQAGLKSLGALWDGPAE